ncbi:FAD-dependent oxidoreductase [Rapidithrix thailandica]|uniref:FAD-dependent oxidoreductase n=1 Tax=Rapidithrix thailandica TaxID=413964 RepID=A0AAW9S480_9BACT
MKKSVQYTLAPEIAFDPEKLETFVINKEGLAGSDSITIQLTNRSIDARSRKVKVNLQADLYVNQEPDKLLSQTFEYSDVSKADPAIIIGAGPAGMFAALRFIELGIKPIVLERGKDVQSRRRDLAAINKEHIVNPESNYCFGEGGAGTYSDGKLYTRSKKRGDFRRILEIFVAHGAREEILIDAHPHIGTNKLPKIVAAIRETILQAGGEVHFDTKVTDFLLEGEKIKGVKTQHGDTLLARAVVLATGHSARDIFGLLHQKNILIERKPFALGVRIEHAQSLIDKIQYHCNNRGLLPAAAYSLVSQVGFKGVKKGVFSFCMCPGGFIVPAATAPGEVVVNGMSPSRRDSKFANSGIVVAIDEGDLRPFAQYGPLAGLEFQKRIEQTACQIAGGGQTAPAQLMADFVNGKISSQLLETSYKPGLTSVDMREVLPQAISHRLKYGFVQFGKKMRGYLTNEAQIVGVESRTSSPVRIPRDRETLEHTQVKGLYPCGEGAGYAGGIASAAMDGERVAERVMEKYFGR